MHDIFIELRKQSDDSITITDISNIVIAVVNLILAFYIFIYQRGKDTKVEHSTARLNEQTINLQWFKELIIQPHLDYFIDVYSKLINYNPGFVIPNADNYQEKIDDYIIYLKGQLYPLSKNFISLFETVDPALHKKAIAIIDEVVENITVKLLDSDVDLTNLEAYEKVILKEVINSKKKLISLIYSFKAAQT